MMKRILTIILAAALTFPLQHVRHLKKHLKKAPAVTVKPIKNKLYSNFLLGKQRSRDLKNFGKKPLRSLRKRILM